MRSFAASFVVCSSLASGFFIGCGETVDDDRCLDGCVTTATGPTGATTGAGASGSTSSAESTSSVSSSSSSGTGGGGVATAECATAADCSLENDCCACAGYPTSGPDPSLGCAIDCAQDRCDFLGYSGSPDCQAHRCVAGFVCDPSLVACDALPPTCAAGETPSVVGTCWGPCVPASECRSVSGCDQCAAGQACVLFGGGFMATHCVETAAECGGTPTCACMGASICGSIPCGDDGAGHLTCQVP